MTATSLRSTTVAAPTGASWVLACAAAEGIGMMSSALAARAADQLSGPAALAAVVAGGLVEGAALGILQSRWLARRFPGVSRLGWILTTLLVAGLGWSIASAGAMANGSDGSTPPVGLILIAAAGLGVAMGAVMGAVQAFVLRGHVRHPWRWVGISAAAWTPAMTVIFVGATLPDESWKSEEVVGLGLLTGLVAGATLGLVSLALMRGLDGPSVWARGLSWLLLHDLKPWGRAFAVLRVHGIKSGRTLEFPVQYNADGRCAVVLVGMPERKLWWRNLRLPSPMFIWLDNAWRPAVGHVVAAGTREFRESRSIYQRRWPATRIDDNAVLVRIDLDD